MKCLEYVFFSLLTCFIVVAILFFVMLAANRWQLPYKQSKIEVFLSYKYCIYFIIKLDSLICFGVCCCELWGLAYVKWDTLDMTI